jgi:phenylalanyl-tRNA synthetase alpha chain
VIDPLSEEQAADRAAAAGNLDELRQVEADVLGKRSPMAQAQKELGQERDPDERRRRGADLQERRKRLEGMFAARRAELEAVERARRLEADRLDLSEAWRAERPTRGHLHLVTQARDRLEDTFVAMGYSVAEGPEVEDDWHNFEALNMPPAHPARSMWDTFYLKLGEPESIVLRTHTSPVQIRVMQHQPPPIYSVMPGRCYRNETPDARHLAVFHQIEGLVVDRGVTFGDLAGTIEAFTEAFFGPGMTARLRPSYFPFTEPSAEFEVTCPFCAGEGCRTCSGAGWIELGGCGMVDPNVFAAVGIDPEEWSGFAFGFGIDRFAQIFHDVDDLRLLLENDIRFLAQF